MFMFKIIIINIYFREERVTKETLERGDTQSSDSRQSLYLLFHFPNIHVGGNGPGAGTEV